jgi:hypothetical protein
VTGHHRGVRKSPGISSRQCGGLLPDSLRGLPDYSGGLPDYSGAGRVNNRGVALHEPPQRMNSRGIADSWPGLPDYSTGLAGLVDAFAAEQRALPMTRSTARVNKRSLSDCSAARPKARQGFMNYPSQLRDLSHGLQPMRRPFRHLLPGQARSGRLFGIAR